LPEDCLEEELHSSADSAASPSEGGATEGHSDEALEHLEGSSHGEAHEEDESDFYDEEGEP
jgi:hypothetical protein